MVHERMCGVLCSLLTTAPPPRFEQDIEHVLLWSILDFVFVMKRYRMEVSPNDSMRVDACLEVVSRIADEIDTVAQNGMLIIMQDSASCMTANLVDFARKVCSLSIQLTAGIQILHALSKVIHSDHPPSSPSSARQCNGRRHKDSSSIRRALHSSSVECTGCGV